MKKSVLIFILSTMTSITAQARYYDPTQGRFLTPDIIVEEPSDPQSLNRYSYVRNNPINFNDPLGLWRVGLSFHLGLGGHFFYDSDNGRIKGGLGAGLGMSAGFGNSNWDIGFSNDNYVDFGYDNKLMSGYIQGK
ncbi:MAG: RHS repeat-associated core domain-containing protein, partial [Elusimicrobiota bacterium]